MAPAGNGLSFKRLLSLEIERATGRKSSDNSSSVRAMAIQTPRGTLAVPITSAASATSSTKGTSRPTSGGDLADLRVLADIATQRSSLGPGIKVRYNIIDRNIRHTCKYC